MTPPKRSDDSDYDELVNWERRLAREEPFFRRLFAERGVHRIADVGAGSARHAIMFRSWGYDVVAIDPAQDMLAQARENAARLGSDVRIAEGSFGDVAHTVGEPVDAITCTGNALPHVCSLDALREALNDFAAALMPGGVLVLHYLNHYRLIEHNVRSVAPVFRQTASGDKFFMRLLDYTPEHDGILFDFVTLVRDADLHNAPHTIESWPKTLDDDPTGGWTVRSRRSVHFAMPLEVISAELERAGFANIQPFGDHTGRALDLDADESLIIVAERIR